MANKGISGYKNKKYYFLSFVKNTQKQKRGQREQIMSTMSTQQSTCFCCLDDLSYGLNTLGPLCLWQCFQNVVHSHSDGHKFYTNMSFRFCAQKLMSTLWFDLKPMHKHTFYQYRQMTFLSGAQMPKCISITRGIVSLLSGQCQASNHIYFCLRSRVGGNPVQKI